MTTANRLALRIPAGTTERLDRALARELRGTHSRTEIARWVRDGRVLLNGRRAKAASEVREGDAITIDLPAVAPYDVAAEDLPIDVVYEDEDLAVVDKPAGMTTHPAGPLRTGTLVNALLFRLDSLSGVGGVMRPGIVHRLDRGTSGLLVVAKNDEAHRGLSDQLKERTLKRTYEAVAWGVVTPESFTIDAPIGRHPRDRKRMAVVVGGREARSHVRVLSRTDLVSAVRVELETGRTHQIRVHLRSRGHPIVGDAPYGGRQRSARAVTPALAREATEILAAIQRPALHARRLRLVHPRTGRALSFQSDLPADFRHLLEVSGLRIHSRNEIE